jgi:hypothetical protein
LQMECVTFHISSSLTSGFLHLYALSPQAYAAGAASKRSVRKCMVDEGSLWEWSWCFELVGWKLLA